ncbi:hypothetical protein FA13DRAFT_1733552 [Coprinellus micaceus]|uniref:Nephrocystin 3-like N-terminal domain-containing protein n=1 Tax=Coprinellus micaceus TaxID=71717 RepID=A0A4Y7TAU3_COPMI|nr:hypothetical protein FA13DRAFT_1733552 [Coprinellus micaceus]
MSTHHFAHAHDFNIGSLTITGTEMRKDPFQHLYDNIAIDAVHNSAGRYDAPKCHEDTRKAVQEEIHGQIQEGDDDAEPKKILWLTGPAGTGKTAIAGSIADTCDEEGLLAGSFFFASFLASETRRSKRCSSRPLRTPSETRHGGENSPIIPRGRMRTSNNRHGSPRTFPRFALPSTIPSPPRSLSLHVHTYLTQ